jgi:hypothetical protein
MQATVTFQKGERVETLIAAPHPAAFSGVVLDVGDVNGRVLVQDDSGLQRVYTPESLRRVER